MNVKRFVFFVMQYAVVVFPCVGTDLRPWYGDPYEIYWDADVAYQTYSRVAINSHTKKNSSDDVFLHAGIGSALGDEYAVEAEITAAHTSKHHCFFDNIRITGRYLLADDVAGDSFSIAIGVTGIQALTIAVDDISSFHHGNLEGEIHIAIGREIPCGLDWGSRWWIVAAIGTADVGSPWWRSQITWDYHILPNQELSFFLHALGGMGSRALDPHDFHGYGPIRHLSADLGFSYRYEIECFGSFCAEYFNRVYARNFPAYVNYINLSFCYPFGL